MSLPFEGHEHRSSAQFSRRHIGPMRSQVKEMLETLSLSSLDQLADEAIPPRIRTKTGYDLKRARSEAEVLTELKELASQNKVFRSMIGLGYYGTFTPAVIQRNILENPGWYTAYTPYQAEIAQGRLEALLNFQTMVTDLTGLQIAGASLLDEGTAVAEAMALAYNVQKGAPVKKFFVDERLFPQSIEVLQARALPLGLEMILGDYTKFDFTEKVFAVFVQAPFKDGSTFDFTEFFARAKAEKALSIVAADLLACCLYKCPGEMGADIAVGTTQRFGVPMCYGGPHAGYMATREEFKRLIPGRIVGVSKDARGNRALRLALQTREQHIRREKATSNICTAQVLLAVMASMYAVYHGPNGLKRIAQRAHHLASGFRLKLEEGGLAVTTQHHFDTLTIKGSKAELKEWKEQSQALEINFWFENDTVSLSFDETTDVQTLEKLESIFLKKKKASDWNAWLEGHWLDVPAELHRRTAYLEHPIFNQYHSETELLRYIFRLEKKDLSLTHSMIPLGSCTMKLNATTEMIPVTWPEFAHIHPFAPLDQTKGYVAMIRGLEHMLAEITGFKGISLQPNAGSQGEFAGLLVIREYHHSRGEAHRNVCIIPSSAHGTNPASAVMAGMKVVVVRCDDQGNIDMADLRAKADAHKNDLSCLMVTYPSTYGVFEESITEICEIVHSHGGQVYMDGANMNALVGLCKPGEFGADVSHLNLHKTFCIPHGGGGPGVGPIGVAEHLKEFLPKHSLVPECGPTKGISAVSSAPWGSAGILVIPWAYIAMMGVDGLRRATEVALLSANYIAKKLEPHYPVLYRGRNQWVAHECIIDARGLKQTCGVTVDDIAKRLMDYGFHAPTMSWPVAGTLMIEPTESESKEELDRFIDAMISIRKEIAKVEKGEWTQEDNPLHMAPHTARDLAGEWARAYTREEAVFPRPWVTESKFWPAVNRVDNAYGDKNLVCACPPIEEYEG